jgi:anti-sigma-K factor RskA
MRKAINTSFLKKVSGKRYMVILAGILAVAALHFAAQISFIQNENPRSAELIALIEDLKSDEKLAVEIKQPDTQTIVVKPEEYEVRKVKVITIPENEQPVSRRQVEAIPPATAVAPSTQPKKKAVRDTRGARLRRAERILTGI